MLLQKQEFLQVPSEKKHSTDAFRWVQIIQILLNAMGSWS